MELGSAEGRMCKKMTRSHKSICMALAVFKLAGVLATAGLVADVSYIQFVETSCEAGSGVGDNVVDLFDLVPGSWSDVVRITALALSALGATATLLEVLCPQTLTRITTRPAGVLVATTTSTI